jgi:ascorbate-specific PTS system EIIC-type component UlaA
MAVLNYRFRSNALVIAGVLAALLSLLVVDSSVGPGPLVWLNFKYGTVVIHVPWLIALFFISAVATFLAKRNGARLSQCLLVGISPALIIGTLFSLLMAVIVVMAASGGRRVYPRDFIGHMLVSWLVIPVGAALLGTLPLLGAPSIKTSGKQIARM